MIGGVVLAAGTSSRLGRPKQTLVLGDRPVLQHVVDAAASAGLDELVVVLGHKAEEVGRVLRLPPGARTVVNPEFASGQASSLRAGFAALDARVHAGVVMLGDQPGVSPASLRGVVEVYRRGGGPVVQATYGGRRGHPVLFDRSVWAEVAGQEGDLGAREALERHSEWVREAEVGGEPPADLDTWEDYQRLKAGG